MWHPDVEADKLIDIAPEAILGIAFGVVGLGFRALRKVFAI